jgi:hypothetical protein
VKIDLNAFFEVRGFYVCTREATAEQRRRKEKWSKRKEEER